MDVVMPQLGETVKEGTVTAWHKMVGEPVKQGERLFEVTTEKVDTEIPAPASGVLSAIIVAEGVTVTVGTTLAVIEEAVKPAAPSSEPSGTPSAASLDVGGSAATAARPNLAASASSAVTPSSHGRRASTASGSSYGSGTADSSAAGRLEPRAQPAGREGAQLLSPVVRKLIGEHNLDPTDLQGSGAGGRITRDDVLSYLARRQPGGTSQPAPAAATSPLGSPNRLPLSRIRKRTAEQMALSWKTIPHVFQAVEVDFYAVEAARGAHGQAWRAKEAWPLTYLPFVAHALCAALAEFPALNATFAGDSLLLHPAVNLGIAVDLGAEGLIVPVVKEASRKSVPELARAIHLLVEKARGRQLGPDDVTQGTYTLSSSGNFGTFFTAPIINPPQVGILSIDEVTRKPVVLEVAGAEEIAIRPVVVLGQSFDHRALDGAYSAAFLRRLKAILEGRDWLSTLG